MAFAALAGRLAAAIFCLLPAACFQASGGEWAKQGVDGNIAARDLGLCQREARLQAGAEAKIDQDIIASRGTDWQRTGSYAGNVDQLNASNATRERDMVARCMKSKGYAQGGQG
jgi:hypothetical protein